MKKIIIFLIETPKNIIANIRRQTKKDMGFDPFPRKAAPASHCMC